MIHVGFCKRSLIVLPSLVSIFRSLRSPFLLTSFANISVKKFRLHSSWSLTMIVSLSACQHVCLRKILRMCLAGALL
ncbi:hypothetical protein EUGRSUZ_C01504 [Eucalyptus grandis]|uniref:Uncharacterized protein n=2 Tax=Eucalyptus grandis TaxID=71139 RepID=A0A059CPN3_EUCGR|nr:hypothetical protein EUGRSUZ_C01504 [Eucalyptus grandis]